MASSLYAVAFVDALDPTGLALDMTSTSNKCAMFNASLAPNFLTDSDFLSAPYTTNEFPTSGNYAAGGQVMAGPPTWVAAGASPVITWDATDNAWTGVTGTGRFAIYYADALATNNVFYCLDFGSNFTATAGPFTIQYNASGIFTWTL